MATYLPDLLLWLFILNLGIAFGAGLYETRIILPQWFVKSQSGYRVNVQAMRETDTGRKFWGFVTTLPLTLLTLVNIWLAWRSSAPRHDWWLTASLIVLAERISTFAFFIPTAIKLTKEEALPTSEASSLISLWIGCNYVRNTLTLVGWLAALRVLSLPLQ